MTFIDGKMPNSTDLVELTIVNGEVHAECIACGADLGATHMLNFAIKKWTDHQEDIKNKEAEREAINKAAR